MTQDLTPKVIRHIRRTLLRWYDREGRTLPWRVKGDIIANPYHVLVSEAMLQQTQVATVIDYFHRFIEAFSTLEALAQADEQQVLKYWQGLGYYRRARNLHAAAKMILDQFEGHVPTNVDDLQKLPGVGRYTAGAIASIAYQGKAPILDGNVARVLSRWFAMDRPIDQTDVKKLLWQWADQLVPSNRPGDFNQAMMDLGAMVCTPQSPACLTCPLTACCVAREKGLTEALPKRLPRKKPTEVTHHVLAVKRQNKWLFEQRPDTGLWSKMWQMPTAQQLTEDANFTSWVQERFGLVVSKPKPISQFTHQTTHRTIYFKVWQCETRSGRLKPHTGQWRQLNHHADMPLAKPQQRVIAMLSQ